jgi:cytochrome c-type biogenesis protein CcmH/NrfG
MKKTCILLLAALMPLLPACDKSAETKVPAAASERAVTAAELEGPNYAGLIEEYRAVLDEDPHDLAAVIALGNAYFDSGQWANAASAYERALRINPRNPDVRTDMGTAYRNMGMPDRALAEYVMALHHDPDHLHARFNMGIVYGYDKKDYKAAIRAWEELLKLAPNYPKAEYIRSVLPDFRKALKRKTK